MDGAQARLTTMPPEGNNSEELKNVESPGGLSSNADVLRELGSTWQSLTRVELDIARSSEKILNLNSFLMHVATRENDLEVFVSENKHEDPESAQEALEVDFLSGFLDLEIGEIGSFLDDIHMEILDSRRAILSCENGGVLAEMKVKLQDSEESLRLSMEQIVELRRQSAELKSMMWIYHVDNNCDGRKGGDVVLQRGRFSSAQSRIKMHTEEQQRSILSMLEKSLARELDLEKKLTELRQSEEEIKRRLQSSEHETLYFEEEAATVREKMFEAEHTSELLMSISKEKSVQLQIMKSKLNNALQHESELESQFQDSIEMLTSKNIDFQFLESSSKEIHNLLIEQITELKSSLKDKEEKLLISNNEASYLKEKIDSLEKQQNESELQLQTATAAAQASREKEGMLISVFSGMEDEITDLKLKLSTAEARTEMAEANCIRLSGSNGELERHIVSLGNKIKFLEKSLSHVEEVKFETAKSINLQIDGLRDLSLRLAVERQHLHKQLSALIEQNSFLREKLKEANKDLKKTSILDRDVLHPDYKTKGGIVGDKVDGLRNTSGNEVENTHKDVQSVRRIDVSQIKLKHVLATMVVFLVVIGVCSLEERPHVAPF